ncbi:MAG: hypothetical protein ACLU4N_18205 [Butyricimonas faecihominis]
MTDYQVESATRDIPGQYDAFTDKDIETVGFVRLKQLTLGYNVPRSYEKLDWNQDVYSLPERIFLDNQLFRC